MSFLPSPPKKLLSFLHKLVQILSSGLQEFINKINYICCLEAEGKIHPIQDCEEIEILWQQSNSLQN